jgi:SAM-dependent methyltransferase
MALEVLHTKLEIEKARARLVAHGISCLTVELPPEGGFLKRLFGTPRKVQLGDALKSWDVLKTAEFILGRFPKKARVLDIGAYNSEILCVLHRLGFRRLAGIDLNPGVKEMPYRESIRYEIGSFLHTPFSDGSFDVVTSISVIEHGFDAEALLAEVSRLLVPDGCFIASFDYWPEKIDTADTQFFGMDWCIFSREELLAFIEQARDHGLAPEGDLAFDAAEPTVHCAERDYTFAWIALRKR